MERVNVLICLLVLLVAQAGCASKSATESNATAEATKSGSKQKSGANDDAEGPAEAVFVFLEAVRTGDDAKANEMLTEFARENGRALDMVVAPPGSETASFEVGEVEMVSAEENDANEETAHVACTWTDIDDEGEPHADEIVWALRRQPEGWRIAGMATKIFEDQPPLLLNFEDPEDMQRKQRLAEDEFERRARNEAEDFVADQNGESSAADGPDAMSRSDDAQGDVADEGPEEEPRREALDTKPKSTSKSKRR